MDARYRSNIWNTGPGGRKSGALGDILQMAFKQLLFTLFICSYLFLFCIIYTLHGLWKLDGVSFLSPLQSLSCFCVGLSEVSTPFSISLSVGLIFTRVVKYIHYWGIESG